MPVADHRKATEAMLKIRDILVNEEEEPTRDIKMALTCAGISIQRRVALNAAGTNDMDATFFVTTLGLLFALVVMCQSDTPRPSGAGGSEDEDMPDADEEERNTAIAAWEGSTLESAIRAAEGVETSSWASTLRHPGALCQSCLQTAAARSHELGMAELANIGALFFRQSAQALIASLLSGAPTQAPTQPADNFLTLGSLDFLAAANNNLDENLKSIADCADSESGQTILRDLILSFKLPRSVVGVRRTCLLSRESNKVATEKYSNTLGGAHDAAMRGAPWTYEKDEDDVHRMCALLAGIAVQMCKNAQSVRKDDMFYGRVDLPFLETNDVPPFTTRLALIEHTHEWVVYHVDKKMQPVVQLRQSGYEGLKQAVLLFRSKLSTF